MFHSKNIFSRMMRFSHLAILGFAALLFLARTDAVYAAEAPPLGTAEDFAVLAGSTVTNTGSSVITSGNVGVSPGSAVTGFPPGIVMPPYIIHAGDAVAAQAQIDLTTAYNNLAGQACDTDLTGQDLGGMTLVPGVYCFSTAAQLTGTLTLDALGDSAAVFVFQIGSTLTTATNSSVLLTNGAVSRNVFWQVGTSATLGTATTFAGNILALTSITLNTGADMSGRALARNGAVTLDGNAITVPCPLITLLPTVLPAGTVNSPYSQTITASGGLGPYAFTMTSGTLPTGLSPITSTGLIAGTPTVAGTFTFTITATDANDCTGLREYTIVIPLISARLELRKVVRGGTASAVDFILTATGDATTGMTVVTGTTPVGPVNVPVGIYTITETGPGGYTKKFTVTNGGTLDGNRLTIGPGDAGKTIILTITNTDTYTPPNYAKLRLLKTLTGGMASATDFILTATGDATTGLMVVTGETPVGPVNVPVGVYTLTENGPDGYTSSGFTVTGGGSLVGNRLTITEADAGNTITATIVNTFTPLIAAKLELRKTVSGGTSSATDFILTATGPVVVTGTTPVGPVNVPVGVYTLTESGPVGYIAKFSVSGGGTLDANTLTITEADAGKTITITITNEFIPAISAKIGLLKTVTGGTASIGDFTLTATGGASTGPTVVTGISPVTAVNVPVGVYTITESGPAGYMAVFSVTGGGTLDGNKLTITEADAGKTITIAIANTFNPIPTVSEWGMIILTMLMGLTFIYCLKKREETI